MFEKIIDKHMGKIAIAFGTGALLFGIIVIGATIYNLSKHEIKVEKIKDEKDSIVDENKERFLKSYDSYIDYNKNIEKVFYIKEEYNKQIEQPNNSLELIWKQRQLLQYTPFGNVIMFYNAYKNGFSYYCDEQIPYSILNSIAMKYVLTYYCRDFFIDNSIIPKDKYSPFLHIHEIEKAKTSSKKIDVSKGPFAKLKTYKPDKKDNREIKTENELQDFIKNKFICCGKIYQYSPLPRKPKKAEKKNIPMNYSDFKQWHNPERFELIPNS